MAKAKNEKKLGKPGRCVVCGKPGTWTVDPYDADVNNRTTIEPLCSRCERERADDI